MATGTKAPWCFAVVFLAAAANASEPTPSPQSEPIALGLTAEAAIEVCDPAGERQYLARLVCPNSEHPSFERIGSMGMRNQTPQGLSEKEQQEMLQALFERRPMKPGDPDYHVLDGYDVTCGDTSTTLYLDMYHCGQEPPTTAPPGFTLIR